jgi:K+-transporting ATPase ATPase B chain
MHHPILLYLFVCLIPTTIGGFTSAIRIAGMDRALHNVITKVGKAVETAGDIDVYFWIKQERCIGNKRLVFTLQNF